MISLALILLACTGVTVDPVDDVGLGTTDTTGESVYDINRLLQVEVTLDPDDWEALRFQARNFLEMLTGECLEEPFESPYTWYSATVTIDGTTLEEVAIRKKGLLGSVVPDRPSLKLSFDKYVPDQLFEGLERLTLNNGRQDYSRIKQCLGYGIYADAGLPASRCSYAHVTVNGEDLGVYANVEPIKKAFLRRNFGNDDGNLYEGTLSDFLDGWTGTFEHKSGDGDPDDLDKAVEAVAVTGDAFEAAVDSVFDLDEFFQAWSLEALIGHWDSYTANRNNFYVYADPDDGGRFSFLPWGIDAILEGDEPFGDGRPTSITGESTLAARIQDHPELVERYEAALFQHLVEDWDEDALLARIDHAEALTGAYAWPNGDDDGLYDRTLDNIRDFVRDRRAQVEAEWAGTPPDAALPDPGDICLDVLGTIALPFSSTQGSYGTRNTWSHGDGTWTFALDGVEYPVQMLGAVFGESDGFGIFIVSGQLEDGRNIAVYGYTYDPDLLTVPATLTLDWSTVITYLLVDNDGDYQDWEIGAYLGGTLTLEQAGSAYGSELSGTFDLEILGSGG